MDDFVRSYSGRDFTSKDMEQIKWARQTYPELTRTGLSKVICSIIDWVNAAGKPKHIPCLAFIEILEKEGKLDLPPIDTKRIRKKYKIICQKICWHKCFRIAGLTSLQGVRLGIHKRSLKN